MAIDDTNNKRPDWHSGYIVTLNTLARFFSDTRMDVEKYCSDIQSLAEKGHEEFGQHPHTYMTFGDFDRITFTGVDRFSRFFDLDKRSKYWLGKHQNIYLYQINSDPQKSKYPGPRLYPYNNTKNKKNKNPYYNDFGFCIYNSSDDWCLFSSNYGYDAEYNNNNINKTTVFPFLILTQISLSNDILFRILEMEEFLIQLRDGLISRLDSIIERHCCEIKYEIYGCLNTSELCILWIAEQYTDVLFLLDEMKKMEFEINGTKGSLFFSFYSIIGRLISNSSSIYKSAVEKCNGIAQVDIIVNNTCSSYDLLNTLKEQKELKNKTKDSLNPDEKLLLDAIESSCIRVGEHDISLRVPTRLVYDFFNEHGHSSKKIGIFKRLGVREKILGTRVSLLYENSTRNQKIHIEPLKFDLSVTSDKELIVKQFTNLSTELNPVLDKDSNSDSIRPLYLWIRDALKENFSSHTGSVDTLDMLYTDYLSNIHESYNAVWRNDYNYQFKNSLMLLKLQLEKVNKEKGTTKAIAEPGIKKIKDENQGAEFKERTDRDAIKFWDLYPQIIDNIRQQTAHFSQSGRLVMRIPSSHLRYTACCDLMFHGYYGMVKAILFDAYSKQEKNTFQSELLPVITTNSNTDIGSKLFFVGPHCNDLRLLHIDIPYSLLYDPVIGFPYMVHEMFHYIAPSSRDKRNEAIGLMVINEVLTLQYMQQFYEGIKLYDFEQFTTQQTKDVFYQKQNTERKESIYSSDFDKLFEKKVKKCTEKDYAGKEVCHNVVNELAGSLKRVLWVDQTIIKIRENIIESVICETRNNSTWTNFLDCLEEKVSQLPLPVYEIISERLLQNMYEKEQKPYKSGEQYFIGCSEALNIPTKQDILSIYEKIIYKHKLTLLNPNSIYRANVKSTIIGGIKDTFIRGLREASPDMAMAMYCQMDEVSYLVSYARQIDSSISKMTASYEIVRIPIVLAWIYCNNHNIDKGVHHILFQCFNLRSKRNVFIKEYMVEYLHQNPTSDKLVKLVSDAIVWYWRFTNIIYAFLNEYSMYEDEIIDYGKCYSVYYKEADEDRTSTMPTLRQLVRTAKKRREQKIIDRMKLLDKELWNKIILIGEYCDNNIIDSKTPPVYDRIFNHVKCNIRYDFDEKALEEYRKRNLVYNQTSFKTSLQFIHQSARQISLEDLKKEVKESKLKSKDIEKEEINEQLSVGNKISDQIEVFTVKRAWGMTEFTDILKNVREIIGRQSSPSSIWYLAKNENECILPSAHIEEKDCSIYEFFDIQILDFFNVEQNNIPNHMILPKMTIDNEEKKKNIWKTNLIIWKRDLVTCLKQFNHLGTVDSKICLYLFSPQKYLRAREFIMNNLGIDNEQSLNFKHVPSISSTDKTEQKKCAFGYFLKTENTESIIESIDISEAEAISSTSHLQYVMPVPFIIEKDTFLAYNLALHSKKGKISETITAPEFALYPIDQIQTMMLSLIYEIFQSNRNKEKSKKEDKEFEIYKWAFIYTIKIDRDIVDGITDLTN